MSLDLARRLAVARGDEPAGRGRARRPGAPRCSRGNGSTSTSPIADGWIAGLGEYDGARGRGRGGPVRRAGLHRRAHAPRVVEAPRSTSSRARSSRTGRPPSSPTRMRSPTCSGSTASHWLLDACAGIPLDVYFMASSLVPASSSSRRAAALDRGRLEALLRRRRVLGVAEMMNFPGVIAGDERELAKLAPARRMSTATRRASAAGLSRPTPPPASASDHEAYDAGRGTRAAPRRDVAVHPRGLGRAQPPHAAPARRETGPHRIAFCTDDREPDTSPRTATSTRWCATRWSRVCRRRTRS